LCGRRKKYDPDQDILFHFESPFFELKHSLLAERERTDIYEGIQEFNFHRSMCRSLRQPNELIQAQCADFPSDGRISPAARNGDSTKGESTTICAGRSFLKRHESRREAPARLMRNGRLGNQADDHGRRNQIPRAAWIDWVSHPVTRLLNLNFVLTTMCAIEDTNTSQNAVTPC
jgi:hypothetical protein